MNDMQERSVGAMELLDGIGIRAIQHAKGAAYNLIELGHDIADAKPLVKHGEWEEWVRTHCFISERYAQQLMQIWTRYGNAEYAPMIGTGKLMKMLSLPEGTEEKFVEENDVESMTVNEVSEAVKAIRRELEEEKRKRIAAEERAEREAATIPDDIADTLRAKDDEISRLSEAAETAISTQREAVAEASRLSREVRELEEELEDKQSAYDEMKQQLMDAMEDGGSGQRPSDEIDGGTALGAARQFVSVCAEIPYMGTRFAMMNESDIGPYRNAFRIIGDWYERAKSALDRIEGEWA